MSATVEVLRVAEPTLAGLAATANREHQATQEAILDSLRHAIAAGEVLIVARQRCSFGDWGKWMAENLEIAQPTVNAYMRIARFQDVVFEAGVTSIDQARQLLSGLPPAGNGHPDVVTREKSNAIRQMHAQGLTHQAIAESLGVSKRSVARHINPEAHRRANANHQARRKAQKEAARQQAIKRALVREGEAFNEVYAVVTRLDGLLGQARKEAQTREKREAINEAHALRDKMMDTLVRALGVA